MATRRSTSSLTGYEGISRPSMKSAGRAICRWAKSIWLIALCLVSVTKEHSPGCLCSGQPIPDSSERSKGQLPRQCNKQQAQLSVMLMKGGIGLFVNRAIELSVEAITFPDHFARANIHFYECISSFKRVATIMSLIQSARPDDEDPYNYFKEMLTRLPTHRSREIQGDQAETTVSPPMRRPITIGSPF
ncbi:hypothetical protein PputUW4_02093 [Pseudomonas sp. UW4]|nr:hypothetical protein PputUW4_02093 [Pseudomonas sp. UW4]